MIEFFPSMPFKADVKIYENSGTTEAPERGQQLYVGQPEIIDEPTKGLKRLKCKIALSEIAEPKQLETPIILDFTLGVNTDIYRFSRYDLRLNS
jgi:hypothetical protein